MRSLSDWLIEYGESHTHPSNIKLHIICVPLIMFSLLGLLNWLTPWLVVLIVIGALCFYAMLSITTLFAMAVITTVMLLMIYPIKDQWLLFIGIFIVAWIGQFIGHAIEGKKPSFFKDIQFLLIGPLWILKELNLLK